MFIKGSDFHLGLLIWAQLQQNSKVHDMRRSCMVFIFLAISYFLKDNALWMINHAVFSSDCLMGFNIPLTCYNSKYE